MPRRRMSLVALLVASVVLAACGGGDDEANQGAGGQANTTTTTLVRPPATTVTTVAAIEGVQTFGGLDAGHSEAPVTYPQVPPVGGIHNPIWQACGFYPSPVPNERAVHSLEHGAIWITFRPDLPQADVDALATLARSRNLMLASRWDTDLPAPVVATGWGRQLRLQSASDPRLAEFVRLYASQGPEINAPC